MANICQKRTLGLVGSFSYVLRFQTDLDGEKHDLRIRVEQQSASQAVAYPEIAGPVWPWLLVLGALAAAVLAFLVVQRAQTVGRLSG